jgi:threonine dehydrogenase-like Zn-dependent dehydrogenase
MQALTVTPGTKDSLQLREVPDPPPGEGSVLVESLAVGLCGTDREIVAGEYGQYTEHGIKGRHGFARERWRADPDGLVRIDAGLADVGVLLEPTTIVAKAWEQIDRIGRRAFFDPTGPAWSMISEPSTTRTISRSRG